MLTYCIMLLLLLLIDNWYEGASNILISQPPQINGNIAACAGEEISLTCSHVIVASETTTWIISSPVNCLTEIVHNPPALVTPCEPFSFQDITSAEAGAVQLNSTAVVNASRDISGSIIECLAGFVSSPSVGNISLCVIGKLNHKRVHATIINKLFLQMNCLHHSTSNAWKYLKDC